MLTLEMLLNEKIIENIDISNLFMERFLVVDEGVSVVVSLAAVSTGRSNFHR